MKFLTALSETIEIGHLPESLPLAKAFPNRHEYASLLDEKMALVVLICFEEADAFADIKDSASQIATIYSTYRREVNTICLVPFGHLSSAATANVDQVEKLLDKLHRTLTNKGLKVTRIPVAKGNVFFARFLFFDKLRSVKLRSSENSLRKILKSLFRVYGSEKVMASIGKVLQNKQIN